MTKATTSAKAVKPALSAPKIATAWNGVCSTSAKSENEIVKAIENLSAVMVLESRLSVSDQKRFIKGLEDGGKVSSFIKSSHAPALPTWSKLRAIHADFRALPIAKQLSTASASYDLLGAGKGEQIKTLDALQKEIATIRKAKNDKAPKGETSSKQGKAVKSNEDTLKSILAYITALDMGSLTDMEEALIAEIESTLGYKMASA
jgi:hypothetical protein